MNSINPSLQRWVKASMIKQLKDLLKGKPTFIEGMDRQTSKVPNHFEVRLDGPYFKACGSRGEWRAFIEVNILVNTTRDEKNIYLQDNMKGIATAALSQSFCIYKTGNVGKEDGDDGTLFGHMLLDTKDEIKVSEFGMIDTNTEVFQAVVEAHYEMYFTTF